MCYVPDKPGSVVARIVSCYARIPARYALVDDARPQIRQDTIKGRSVRQIPESGRPRAVPDSNDAIGVVGRFVRGEAREIVNLETPLWNQHLEQAINLKFGSARDFRGVGGGHYAQALRAARAHACSPATTSSIARSTPSAMRL